MCYPKYLKHNKTVATTLPLTWAKCFTRHSPTYSPLTRARLAHHTSHTSGARCYDNCEEWSPEHPEHIAIIIIATRGEPHRQYSRAMSLVVNPSILRFNPARKLCYYGGKLRKIFGCIGFKLELTRAITDKKNAGNVGECITKAHPSHVKASLGITFLWFVSNWVGDRSWAQRGGGIVFTCVNTSW